MIFSPNYAAIYDELYSYQEFGAEADTIMKLAAEFIPDVKRPDLLDLGCGTGTHTSMFKNYFNVTGADLSENMLALAKKKNPDIEFHHGDARTIDLGRQFDVVVMMSAVLGYQNTNEQVLATLHNVRKHLKPGGLFVFDVWYGPAVLLERPIPRVRELKYKGQPAVRSLRPGLQEEKNLCTCNYKLWLPIDGKLEILEESHTQRYFFPVEMEMMLGLAGMSLCRTGKPGFVYRPIVETDRDIMFVAKG